MQYARRMGDSVVQATDIVRIFAKKEQMKF
jgi:hypothetical protein